MVCQFFVYLVEFPSEVTWSWNFVCRELVFTDCILLLVIGLFRLSVFSWCDFVRLYVSRRASPQLRGKTPACSAGGAGDTGSVPALGRSPGGGNGNLLQYSCLENPMDRGAWWATVHRVTKSQTWLKQLTIAKHTACVSRNLSISCMLSILLVYNCT